MTHETETLQKERKAEAHSFDLSLLWLWPILLFQAVCEVFADAAQELKGMRRKTYLRPSAPDWAMNVENLRRAEWLSRAYLAGHALSLLAGKPVDPSNALVPTTPDGWRRPEPKTVEAMLRRFEAVTRLYADPMRYIRRLAHRLAAQARAPKTPPGMSSARPRLRLRPIASLAPPLLPPAFQAGPSACRRRLSGPPSRQHRAQLTFARPTREIANARPAWRLLPAACMTKIPMYKGELAIPARLCTALKEFTPNRMTGWA